jgi:hypothetical protein
MSDQYTEKSNSRKLSGNNFRSKEKQAASAEVKLAVFFKKQFLRG